MFEWLKNYLLQQEIKEISSVKKQFVEWEKIQTAVILVSSTQLKSIKDFVGKSGKNFDIIIFHNDKVSVSKECYLSLNRKDFNFFGLPNPESISTLKGKNYDILINTDFSSSWFIKALTGLIPSKCKLGPQNSLYNEFFDMSIQSNEQDFLKQAQKYLMMIKS